MKNLVKSVMAGALVGAGALWAMNGMTRGQRQAVTKFATQTANRVMRKVNQLTK